MSLVSPRALDLIEIGLSASTASAAGRAFFHALSPFGVKAIYARAYRGPSGGGDGEHIYCRVSPPGWESLYAEKRFQSANFLTREVRRRGSPFKWSDISLVNDAERELAHVLAESGFGDGLAIPCHGPQGYVGVISLAFEALTDVAPADRAAIEIASLVVHERMRCLTKVQAAHRSPPLSARERDCMAFVADGLSDNEIADVLGLASPTVAAHIKNARAKLGARTRAQAVAHFVLTSFV